MATKQQIVLWVMTICLALAGCAEAPKRQAYNAEANAQIHDVVIAQQSNQQSFEAAVLAHPGVSFGLIGGLIAAADIQHKTNLLTAAVDAAQTRLQERFSEMLREGLVDRGYAVRVVALPEGVALEQAADQARKTGPADAVLAYSLVGGYWAAGPTTDYMPRLVIAVLGVRLSDGATLYQDTFTYGYTMGSEGTVHFPAPARYRFADIDAIVADPARARDGWIEGLRLISDQVLQDVKRR